MMQFQNLPVNVANFWKAICTLVSAMIFLLSILPVWADEPLTLQSTNPLEQLEAEILKNQERSGKAPKVKPTPPAPVAKVPLPANQPESTVPPKLEPSNENLPPPKRNGSSRIQPSAPQIAVPRIDTPTEANSPVRSDADSLQTAMPSGQSYLGLTLHKPSGNLLGLRVVAVSDKSPAWKSGFIVSDRVLAVSDQAVSNIDEFAEVLSNYAPGESVRFLIDRSGRKKELICILMDRQLADLSLPENERATTLGPSGYLPTNNAQSNALFSAERSLGVALVPLSTAFRNHFGIPAYRGASVLEVRPNSAASDAGLVPGDCLVEFNTQSVESDRDVLRLQYDAQPGDLVPISFYRGGALIQSQIVIPSNGKIFVRPQVQDLPLGAVVRPELSDEVQQEILELRREVQRLREQVQALEGNR